MQPKYLVVAHIARPHGLKGEVEAQSLTDYPERFKEGLTLYLSPPVVDIQSLAVEKVEQRPKNLVFKFIGIDSREEAERIASHDLLVPASEAAELGEEEFWVHDIIGMSVYTVDGEYIGRVSDVLRTGSNDVYVVANTKEVLVSAIKDVVKEISVKDRKITIEPIPGMLE